MIDLSQETETLARRIAALRGVTVDAIFREALEISAHAIGISTEYCRDTSAQAVAARRECVSRFVDEISRMPLLDKRPLQEIVDDLNTL